jgi:predicted aspartyl protease
MQLSFDYDLTYSPSFPIVEFTIAATTNGRQQTIQGLVDSGSDITQIPYSVLQAIGARDVDDRWVRDASGLRVPVAIYVVQIQIGSSVLPSIEVVNRTGSTETIIGRDVLNQFIVTLNGLANITEIRD